MNRPATGSSRPRAAGLALGWLAAVLSAAGAYGLPVAASAAAAAGDAAKPRPASFRAALTGTVFRDRIDPHWSEDGSWFWYRNDLADGVKEFWLVDADRGTRGPAFDHGCVASALERATGADTAGERLPFDRLGLDRAAATLTVEVAEAAWRCDLESCRCAAAEGAPPAAPDAEADANGPEDPAASPDGRLRVEIREHDLWMVETETGEATPLTRHGSAESSYAPLAWSPDGSTLLALRVQAGQERQVPLIAYGGPGEASTVSYASRPFPGDRFPLYEPWLFRPVGGDSGSWRGLRAEVEAMDFLPPRILGWSPDATAVLLAWFHRGQQRFEVARIDCRTGRARTVLDDRAETFVHRYDLDVRWLGDSQEILYASERDGWRHLYLFDGVDGGVRAQITRGPWAVRDVARIDEERRQVWFGAGGREPGRDPYLVHYYRVGLDGTGLTLVTPDDGHHRLQFSPDGEHVIDTWSRVDLPPRSELRRAGDGTLVVALEEADASRLLATGWRWPEPFRAPGRDGRTDVWGVVFRPSEMEEGRRYPVVEQIYPGPQRTSVPKSFGVYPFDQDLANRGFIVVKIDAMGTPGRSKAFHDVSWKNLGDCGFADRIPWLRALGGRYPYVDLGRVGIFGHSAGGYCAVRALLLHPETYDAGWSSSGNHDLLTDSAYFLEQFMGHPVGPHYREQSNLHLAPNLEGRLTLTVGALDRQVPPGNTFKLVAALIEADKDFDLMVFPSGDHSPGDAYAVQRMFDFFAETLGGSAAAGSP